MWYYKLLCALIFKVEEKERRAANSFLIAILSKVDRIFAASKTEPVPPLVYLALVDKMYKTYGQVADESVKLEDFTRELFTLVLILSKSADDDHIYIKNFKRIIRDQDKLKTLGISTTEPMAELKKLEIEQLMKIDFNIYPNLDHVLRILHQHNDPSLHLGLINYFKPLASISEPFDDFINRVSLQYHQLTAATPACPDENRKRKAFVMENKTKGETEEPQEQRPNEVQLPTCELSKKPIKKPRLLTIEVNSQLTTVQYKQEQPHYYLSRSRSEFIQPSPFTFFTSQAPAENYISQIASEYSNGKV